MLIGLVTGLIMQGSGGVSIVGNLIVGVMGAFLGNFLYRHLCELYRQESIFSYGLIGSLVAAFVGAVLLLWIKRAFISGE